MPKNIPVTIKIRKLNNNLGLNNLDANIKLNYRASYADALILHARSYQDDYDVLVDYDLIKNIVASVDIPVIGNGDVKDVNSLNKMRSTGCAGLWLVGLE